MSSLLGSEDYVLFLFFKRSFEEARIELNVNITDNVLIGDILGNPVLFKT